MENFGTDPHPNEQQIFIHRNSSFEISVSYERKASSKKVSSSTSSAIKERISSLTKATAKKIRASRNINEGHPTPHILDQSSVHDVTEKRKNQTSSHIRLKSFIQSPIRVQTDSFCNQRSSLSKDGISVSAKRIKQTKYS